ncbi:type III polyketide synthase [Paralimibaculum aggregatum]|nr:type III polyketide synthase [Limibaculum sp. NKW23]
MDAFLNAIGTGVPDHDIHAAFVDAVPGLLPGDKERKAFGKLAERSGIEHRYSSIEPVSPEEMAERYCRDGFYRPGAFPTTGTRMRRFEQDSPALADRALADLSARLGHNAAEGVTHLVITSCTGFVAPGLDGHLIAKHGLDSRVERTLIGFMGCNAAMNGFKTARHIVRSEPEARVLTLNIELCTLHLQEITPDTPLNTALMFLLFADGAAASIVSAEPTGLRLDGFASDIAPETEDKITWNIGDDGFDMWLSGQVPRIIARTVPGHVAGLKARIEGGEVGLWAVHPGGRTILDAVASGLDLPEADLATSRSVLRDYGNMSSATLSFVLKRMLEAPQSGRAGIAIGFGPGLSIESMIFRESATG